MKIKTSRKRRIKQGIVLFSGQQYNISIEGVDIIIINNYDIPLYVKVQ